MLYGMFLEYCFSGHYSKSVGINCNTSLSSSSNNSGFEWWTLTECTDPLFPESEKLGPPILLIYSHRIASRLFSAIAGIGSEFDHYNNFVNGTPHVATHGYMQTVLRF